MGYKLESNSVRLTVPLLSLSNFLWVPWDFQPKAVCDGPYKSRCVAGPAHAIVAAMEGTEEFSCTPEISHVEFHVKCIA